MSIFQGDFLGFTYDNIHSSTLGITRVSDGSRYTEALFPTIQDKSSIMTGSDGSLYFGSNYTQRQFQLQIAFDDMTEAQLRKLKQVFGDKELHSLIFDELPYKKYKVKITGNPQLKYIAFNDTEAIDYVTVDHIDEDGYYNKNDKNFYRDYDDTTIPPSYSNIINPTEGYICRDIPTNDVYIYINSSFDGNRTGKQWLYKPQENLSTSNRRYKGEGTLNFIAFSVFARSVHKFLNEYNNINNIDEWAESSGMLNENIYPNGIKGYYYNNEFYSDEEHLHKITPINGEFYIDLSSSSPYNYYEYNNSSFNYISKVTIIDSIDYTNDIINVYNPGDFPTDFILRIRNGSDGTFTLGENGLILQDFTLYTGDAGYQINSALHLIQGINNNNKLTGTIYNRFIVDGDFFKIPITTEPLEFYCDVSGLDPSISISYDYLYY